MKKLLLLMLVLSNAAIYADETYKDPYDTGCSQEWVEDGILYCFDNEDKIVNQIMIEFIKSTAAGMVIQQALERFQRDFRELNEQSEREFRRIFAAEKARQARERAEEERRRSREGADGRNGREWGGHLDNRVLPGVARAGMGA